MSRSTTRERPSGRRGNDDTFDGDAFVDEMFADIDLDVAPWSSQTMRDATSRSSPRRAVTSRQSPTRRSSSAQTTSRTGSSSTRSGKTRSTRDAGSSTERSVRSGAGGSRSARATPARSGSSRSANASRSRPSTSSARHAPSNRGRANDATSVRRSPARARTSRPSRSTSRARAQRSLITWRAGNPQLRLRLMAALGVIVVVTLAGRLIWWQTFTAATYAAQGREQRLRTTRVTAQRGVITDRNGEVLARSVPQSAVTIDPRLIPDADRVATATALATLLNLDPASVLTKVTSKAEFAYIARQIDDATATKVREANLNGVFVVAEEERFAPAGTVARGIIGRTDPDGTGIAGMELLYDDVLAGTAGNVKREVSEVFGTYAASEQVTQVAEPGDGLTTTLDRTLQFQLEQLCMSSMNDTQAKGANIVVQEVATGDLIVIANCDRDAAGLPQVAKANLASINTFEPGSVNKVITIASAMEAGAVTPSTVIRVPKRIEFNPDTDFAKTFVEEHGGDGDTDLTVADILARSSNNGTIKIAQMLGRERLNAAVRSFGLGSKTAINFPNEPTGHRQIPNLDKWSGTSLPTIAIGQGVSVTAIQMIGVFTTLANGGSYRPPRLVRAAVGPDGDRKAMELAAPTRVVSEQTAHDVTTMMESVVSSSEGTGSKALIDGYRIAGKTGTARKPQASTGSYYDEFGQIYYVSSFVGYFPADAPRYTILVTIDEPKGDSYYAGDVAAPVFRSAAEMTIARFHVPPAGTTTPSLPVAVGTPGEG
jgi:cell division protein FtsI (penicillin-binding protein 3)